ncbi:MAG: glycosyltransferase, partial [Chloroflexi bacterium]|nr:glycosyltransferase [Chloroflexota bacterium]
MQNSDTRSATSGIPPGESPVTLSVCLIVKNEGRCLARCLESVRPVADEIIIVDTGSTDRTVEIARAYTSKVFFHPWNDDFSEARNVSLSYASGDWVLQMDADEVLAQEDIPLLRQVIQGKEYVAVNVALHNTLPDGLSVHYFPRLFRRGKAHYEGIVHEQLLHEGPAIAREIRILHDGYNLDPKTMSKKYRRNEVLLQRRLQQAPDDSIALAELVSVYREWERFDLVLTYATAALASRGPKMNRRAHYMLVSNLAYAFMQTGHLEEGVQVCKEGLAVHPQSLDLWFTLSGLHFRQDDFSRAAHALRRFLEIYEQVRQRPDPYLTMVGTFGKEAQAWYNLGLCYEALGQPEEAMASYARACELAPGRADFRLALAQALTQQNRGSEAMSHL